jgi:hypothetical protein
MLLHRSQFLLAIILSVLLYTSSFAPAKATATMWTQTYGGLDIDVADSLVATSDGGYALVGESLLVKTDAFGNMEWSKNYGSFSSLVNASDGGYAMAGSISGDFWLVKTDAAGNMGWNQRYGGAGDGHAYSLVATSDGGYALAGYTFSPDTGSCDFLLVKTDETGNMEWNQTYGETDIKSWESASAVVEASDGGYAIAGSKGIVPDDMRGLGWKDYWLVKTDAVGNMEWNRTYTYWDYGDEVAASLVATSDGGYVIAGYQDTSWPKFLLIKTDGNGNIEWKKTYGGGYIDMANAVVQTSDGGYALTGVTRSFGVDSDADFWLVKTDSFGNMQWNQTYGGAEPEGATSLVLTSDGGYALAGYTYSYGDSNGYCDVWLVKTDEYGVVPEATWIILPFFVIATLVIFASKKKLLHKQNRKR